MIATIYLASSTISDGAPNASGPSNGVMSTSGGTVRARLENPTLLLVTAAEPLVTMGAPVGNAQGVFISKDGTKLESFMASLPTGFQSFGGKGDTHGIASIASTPTPRRGFVPVYSRTLEAVFIVGGENEASNTPTGEIWIGYLDSGWARVPTGSYAPETVLAATHSFADNSLWVLDERVSGRKRIARLVRLNLEEGRAEVVYEGTRRMLYDSFWLAPDVDGNVLLFASNSKLYSHATVKIAFEPFVAKSARARAIRFGIGSSLAGAPLVDAKGYQLATKTLLGNLAMHRASALPPGRLQVDLGTCL